MSLHIIMVETSWWHKGVAVALQKMSQRAIMSNVSVTDDMDVAKTRTSLFISAISFSSTRDWRTIHHTQRCKCHADVQWALRDS